MQTTVHVHVFSFRGSGRCPFPEDSGHLGRRSSVNPTWSISDIFRGFGVSLFRHFFAAPAWIILFVCFLLSCPCVVLDKHISLSVVFFLRHMRTCTQHDDTFQQEEYQPADGKLLTKKKIPTPRAPASPQGQVSLAG